MNGTQIGQQNAGYGQQKLWIQPAIWSRWYEHVGRYECARSNEYAR